MDCKNYLKKTFIQMTMNYCKFIKIMKKENYISLIIRALSPAYCIVLYFTVLLFPALYYTSVVYVLHQTPQH